MIARTLPFRNGAVTQTKLVLPAIWGDILLSGRRDMLEMLPVPEQEALAGVTHNFGWCVDMEEATYFAKNHDVAAEGVAPGICGVFTFVVHH